jgi:hypothetical protein
MMVFDSVPTFRQCVMSRFICSSGIRNPEASARAILSTSTRENCTVWRVARLGLPVCSGCA